MSKSYRIGVIADTHTGSQIGLRRDPQNPVQVMLYKYWLKLIPRIQGCDMLVLNGDANDGQDRRGMALQCHDVPWQIEECEALIKMIEPKECRMTNGSSYHVGDTVAYEQFLAGYLCRSGIPTTLKTVQSLDVGWWRGRFRHSVGRSIIPYGRFSSPHRSAMWGTLKAARKMIETGKVQRVPDLYCFSHVHYHTDADTGMGRVITTPGWKAAGTADKFGSKGFDDQVHIGLTLITIHDPDDKDAGFSVDTRYCSAEVVDESERLV